MRPKPFQLTGTTSEQTEKIGPALRTILIKNVGSNTVLLDFDNPVHSDSYPLEAGETLTMEWSFIYLHYKGASTLNIIKVLQ